VYRKVYRQTQGNIDMLTYRRGDRQTLRHTRIGGQGETDRQTDM